MAMFKANRSKRTDNVCDFSSVRLHQIPLRKRPHHHRLCRSIHQPVKGCAISRCKIQARRPGRDFCGARTKSAGLMPGSGEAITMYCALAAGLRALLGRCWLGSMISIPQQISCGAFLGSGLAFGEILASLVQSHEFLAGFFHTH